MSQHNSTQPYLPVELLSHIFDMWIETGDADAPFALPFTLGEVCKQWRVIVWSTPSLWNRITFPLNLDHLPKKTFQVKEAIAHSANLPMVLFFTPDFDSCLGERDRAAFKFLFDSSPRWHTLDLTRLSPDQCRTLLEGPLNLSNLRKLQLHMPAAINFHSHTKIDITKRAHSVEELDTGSYHNLSERFFKINWSNLLSLVVDASAEELPTAVQRATSLRRLSIIDRKRKRAAKSSIYPPPTVQVHLTDFRIEGTHVSNSVFDFAAFPNLKRVLIGPGTVQAASLTSFLIRSQTMHITSLTFCDVSFDGGFRTDMLKELPSLLELKITSLVQREGGVTPDWESWFATIFRCMPVSRDHSPNPPPTIPKLRVFHLSANMRRPSDFLDLRNAFDLVKNWQIPLAVFELSLYCDYEFRCLLTTGQGISLTSPITKHIRLFRDEGRRIEITMKIMGVLHDLTAGAYFP